MVSRFSVENYLSHSAEKFRRGNRSCFAIFGYRKSLCFRGLCHDFRFLFQNFLSQSAENFRRVNTLVFHYFLVSKNFLLQSDDFRFSVERFLSHSAE